MLLTVLLPIYNAEPYLRAALDSLKNQAIQNCEFLCINDGSTDNSEFIIDEYCKSDSRFILVNNHHNLGLIASLNKGISLAKGKFIARQDADDISALNRMQIQLEYLKLNPQVDLVCSAYSVINEHGKILQTIYPETSEPNSLLFKSLFVNPICHGSVMAKAKLFQELQYSTSSIAKHTEDYELWTRMLRLYTVHTIQQPLYLYRTFSGNTSSKHELVQKEHHVLVSQIHILKLLNESVSVQDLSIMSNKFLNYKLSILQVRKALMAYHRIKQQFKSSFNLTIQEVSDIKKFNQTHKLNIVIQLIKRQKKVLVKGYGMLLICQLLITSPANTLEAIKEKLYI